MLRFFKGRREQHVTTDDGHVTVSVQKDPSGLFGIRFHKKGEKVKRLLLEEDIAECIAKGINTLSTEKGGGKINSSWTAMDVNSMQDEDSEEV